jgi:hypothetical protein
MSSESIGPEPVSEFVPRAVHQKAQERIIKQRHELRCIHEAHQRLLFANADLKRENKKFLDRNKALEECHRKFTGYSRGWLRQGIYDLGLFLWMSAR